MLTLPQTFSTSLPYVLTKCTGLPDFKRTDVEVSVCGVKMEFSVPGIVVGDAAGEAGYEAIRAQVEELLFDDLADALAAAG